MTRDELQRLIRGPIATVPTAFDDEYELDLGTMAELTKSWVESGLVAGTAVIKVAAAMGEGPMLSVERWHPPSLHRKGDVHHVQETGSCFRGGGCRCPAHRV